MVFYWSLSDYKSLQVFRTLLSILACLSNAVVWMVSTCPRISKSSSLFTNPLKIVPCALTTVGIAVTIIFLSFFSFLRRVKLLLLLLLFLVGFSGQRLLMVFQWGLRESNSIQVSRNFLRILATLSNAIISMFSTRPSISNSFSPFSKPLETVPSAPVTNGITVTLIFLNYF